MDAFSYIIQKQIDIDNPLKMNNGGWEFWRKYHVNINCGECLHSKYKNVLFYIFSYISSVYYQINNEAKLATNPFVKCKLYQLNYHMENPFISVENRELIMEVYSKTQKTYYAFTRLAKLFISKRIKSKVCNDLCMNELDENSHRVITIIHFKTKYLFLISDLMGIFRSALLNTSYFFPEPMYPKNPYNNIEFDVSAIYNIYFHMEKHRLIIPVVFRLFYNSNLNLDLFLHNNEAFIRDAFIHNYAFASPPSILFKDLDKMMSLYKSITSKLYICVEFPRDKLVEIFRPYLHLYYIRKYSVVGTDKYQDALVILKRKLREFVKFNPCFGRKTIKIIRKSNCFIIPQKKPTNRKEYYININYPSYHNGKQDIRSILEYRIPNECVCNTNRRMFIDSLLDSTSSGESVQSDSLNDMLIGTARINPINYIHRGRLSYGIDSDGIDSDSIDSDSDGDININNIIDRNIDINNNSDSDNDSDININNIIDRNIDLNIDLNNNNNNNSDSDNDEIEDDGSVS